MCKDILNKNVAINMKDVRVIKPFLNLKEGDILAFDYKTAKYKFLKADEDVSEFSYSYDDYEVVLDLWVVEDYMGEYLEPVKSKDEVIMFKGEIDIDPSEGEERVGIPELVKKAFIPIQDPILSELGQLKELVMRLENRLESLDGKLKTVQHILVLNGFYSSYSQETPKSIGNVTEEKNV